MLYITNWIEVVNIFTTSIERGEAAGCGWLRKFQAAAQK
jgi:hypothetical protein